MSRVIRLSIALLIVACLAGCSSWPARLDDTPGANPKVALASLPPGKYSGMCETSITGFVEGDSQSETLDIQPVLMEMELNVEQSQTWKTGCVTITRVRVGVTGDEIDTNIPLPPDPKTQSGSNPSRILREELGKMIGPKSDWEIMADGRIGTLISNGLRDIEVPGVAASQDLAHIHLQAQALFGGQYPKYPVGVGAIWHVTEEWRLPQEGQTPDVPVKIQLETEYNLVSLQHLPSGQTATIKYRCHVGRDQLIKHCREQFATDEDVTARDLEIILEKIECDLTVQGLMHVDVNSGLHLDNNRTTTLKLTTPIEDTDKWLKAIYVMKQNYSAKPKP